MNSQGPSKQRELDLEAVDVIPGPAPAPQRVANRYPFLINDQARPGNACDHPPGSQQCESS